MASTPASAPTKLPVSAAMESAASPAFTADKTAPEKFLGCFRKQYMAAGIVSMQSELVPISNKRFLRRQMRNLG